MRQLSMTQRWLARGNVAARRGASRVLVAWRELQARLGGRGFACRALNGDSDYNISINADLSVSCNCDDVDGSGRLGSLRDASLEAVLAGPRARAMRRRLAAGKIPLLKCVTCPELATVPAPAARALAERHRVPPGGLMLETNGNCNLACVGCQRAARPLAGAKMPLDRLARVAAELGRHAVRRVSFFSLGEPFLAADVEREVRLLRDALPRAELLVSTNGVPLAGRRRQDAALLMDHVTFSLDGCDQRTAEIYQVGTRFDAVVRNMRDLVARRDAEGRATVVNWKYVVFRWNDRAEHLERALRLAREARVDTLEFVFTLNPFFGVSWRFHLARHWRALGPVAGKRRVVVLRPERVRGAVRLVHNYRRDGAAREEAASGAL